MMAYSMAGTTKPGQPKVKVYIREKPISFLVDTGSTVTIIDKATFEKLGRPKVVPTGMRIFAFKAGQPIPLIGEGTWTLSTESGRSTKENVYVTADDNKGCILSCSAAAKLELIKLSKEVTIATIDKKIERSPLKPIGKVKDMQIMLHTNPEVRPVAMPHRRIPYHLREQVEAEIDKLEKLDIIEKVSGPTPWVSPVVIVPKPNGTIRLCVDMRQPNRAIERERHLIPTIKDILSEVSEAKIFSVIDLNQAYHQLELDEGSRFITTFSTHVGLRRYKRLFFGLNSAAEIFHNTLREILSDIEGAINSSDDILIHGRTKAEHDHRLEKVRKRLKEMNITVNQDKQQIGQDSVHFHGVILSNQGLQIDPEKVTTIRKFERPSNATEVRSFLGMTNYCSRFIRGHAELTEPLRKLIVKSEASDFRWNHQCEEAFNKLKEALSNTKNLAFFNPKLKTELIVDASPVGLGAILCQLEENGHSHVVAYTSKALSPTEQRYSQTEREALAIIWGCEQFKVYLIGAKFIVWTDHKALVPLFNNPSSNLSLRMERWMMRKQTLNMEIQYLPGGWNAADYLSRHPILQNSKQSGLSKVADNYVNFTAANASVDVIPPEEIEKETSSDAVLSKVKQAVRDNQWHKLPEEIQKEFKAIRDELTTTENGILMRGNRIVIPKSLQSRTVQLAHEGHQGMTKTKQHLRSRVWFPKMDVMVEDAVKRCIPCQVSTKSKQRAPIQPTILPDGPWKELSIDFYTMPSGEEILVVIDDYSRFPVIEVVRSTSFAQVGPKLHHMMALFGIPQLVKTDNGPPFNGAEFKTFADHLGFRHRKVAPAWPEANGEVERFMETLGKLMRTVEAEKKKWKEELETFARSYRSTTHPGTGYAPAELLLGRSVRNRLPDLQHTDEAYKKRMKENADRRRRTKDHILYWSATGCC